MELQVCSFWISAFSFAETSLYLREAGEREKESARGTMGRGGNKERHPPFPLPIIPRTLTFFIFFKIWIPAIAYLNKRWTSECFAPGVPRYKMSMYVCWLNLCFMRGRVPVYDHKMVKSGSEENKYGLIWLRVICVFVFLAYWHHLNLFKCWVCACNKSFKMSRQTGETTPTLVPPDKVWFLRVSDHFFLCSVVFLV